MATLNATLALTSTDVSSSPMAMTLASGLTVSSPSIGVSRQTATVIAPVTLVPATEGTKYCFVQHTGFRPDGVTATTNTMTLSTVTSAPVAQIKTLLFNLTFVTGDSIALTINGVLQETVPFTTDAAITELAVKQKLEAHPSILSAVSTTGGTSHSFYIVGAFPGDSFTVTAVHNHTTGTTATTDTATLAASGSSHTILRANEFMFIPVKAGEGLQVVAQGGDQLNNEIQLEYAYWTKAVE